MKYNYINASTETEKIYPDAIESTTKFLVNKTTKTFLICELCKNRITPQSRVKLSRKCQHCLHSEPHSEELCKMSALHGFVCDKGRHCVRASIDGEIEILK